ncbi:MAG: D-aminoacylase [Candidatus Bathyarchaeota archaeon]|nr:D-aminoacylase [Candidatus Bathyarchaeota archaeon]
MGFDVVIRDGRIIDGTGNSWYRADVGVKDGRIARINPIPLKEAERVVDATGLLVCPGFVNLHSHSDSTILAHNSAENCLSMGLVTELVGSCGSSVAPITEEYWENLESWGLLDVEVDWISLAEWRERLEAKGIGVNVAPLVGQGTVRGCVMGAEGKGGEKVVPSDEEMAGMMAMVESAMEDGAFGLSTGLTYAPGRNALTGEIVELTRVVAGYGGLYSSHMRCEADRLIEATREFIEICEAAGVRGTISHHKAMGRNNFGKVCETLRMVERARARGVDVVVDLYPWRHGGTIKSLGRMFRREYPDGSSIKTREDLMERLRDPEEWSKVKAAVKAARDEELEKYERRMEEMEERGGWTTTPFSASEEGYVIHSKNRPDLQGMTFGELAEALGEEDFLDAVRELLIADEGHTLSGIYPYSEDDIQAIMEYPWSTVSTDQYAFDASKVSLQEAADALATQHPRGWGTYPKILGKYVREEGVLFLEEAIRKMTSLPANFIGLQDRGLVREGFWADLVVFDPGKVASGASYGDPYGSPEGIHYVLVNGVVAVDRGELTGALAGKVLEHGA